MGFDYECTFDLMDCINALGIEERGKVQQFITNEVLRLSDPYIPFDEGTLKNSGHIENDTDVVWNTPYAHYQWTGIVYEDPDLHCAGFEVASGGWRSRKGVNKVPTDRKLQYQKGALRGPHWITRMLQDGGLKEIEDGARKVVKE